MKKSTIVLLLSVLGFICIMVNQINRNLFDGHLTTLGIILVSISFFYRQFTSKKPVSSRSLLNEDSNSTLFVIKRVLMTVLFIMVLIIMGYVYYLKNK